jgi:competence protein ComEA
MFRVLFSLAAAVVLFAHVASAAQAPAPQPPSKSSSRSSTKAGAALTAPVNINSATAAELDTLPGIGAKTAARIIEYRQKNGPFKKVEELMNVRGVGEKNFLKLKDLITVTPAKAEHAQQ